jgi:hypothetical protein
MKTPSCVNVIGGKLGTGCISTAPGRSATRCIIAPCSRMSPSIGLSGISGFVVMRAGCLPCQV